MAGALDRLRVFTSLDEVAAAGAGFPRPAVLVVDLDALPESALPEPLESETAAAGLIYPGSDQTNLAHRHIRRRRLLRAVVACQTGFSPSTLALGRSAFGAPLLLPATLGLHVSLSTRGTACAVALANEPIGVDIEEDRLIDPLPLDLLHPAEREDLLRQFSKEGPRLSHVFLRLWTLKEAAVKALGAGFRIPPESFSILSQRGASATGIYPEITGLSQTPTCRHVLIEIGKDSVFHLGVAVL